MGKQSKSRKLEVIGKGKVTPVQIAFIVDRYLSDNSFSQTRSTFRSEASNLISKSPVEEAPKTLLSLGAILDEYITLKEQKVWVDQERCRLEQEKLRVQNLLSGMQDVMNAYNASTNNVVTPPPLPLPVAPSASTVSQAERSDLTPAGCYSMHTSPAIMSTSKPMNTPKDPTAFSTPVMYNATAKRKGSKDALDGPVISKRSRRSIQPKDANLVAQTRNAGKNQDKSLMSSAVQSAACDKAPGGSQVHGSNVVKCLFNQETGPPSPPANSSVPKTPPLASSSQTEKYSSPLAIQSTATSNNAVAQQILSANCTIISSETIRVSPTKQISYYTIEKNSISACSPLKKCSPLQRSNMKDHVKGRLDFGPSEMPVIAETQTSDYNTASESEKEGHLLDLDFPNLDAFGLDFNLSEFLDNFDIGTDGMCLSSEQALVSSPDCNSGSPSTSQNVQMDAAQVASHFSANMTGVLVDKDLNLAGAESVEAMRSVTKCIRIVSPVKSRSNLDQ